MKKILALLLIILAGGMLFFLKEHYRHKKMEETAPLDLTWTMSPAVINDLTLPVSFVFHLSESSHKPIADAEIDLVANMTHPGMVPVSSKTKNLGNGKYLGSFLLTMHGDWILFLTIKLKNGVAVKKEILFKTAQ
jgi:hypothetical protein